ncbi:hypothetical protein COU01_00360 [Candidatus Falkowbacteria bacterium CG10_big_fil_rev_8_21_14_0_10_44_15]|uniref:Succinylglutamate desuccinylase/Aspartoacylase catalytic domain-containing protein n=1 Tax=Candidatus Falkowbacteria bacterium CG10_big_fil_rev_8_21_14_0_10_44_15 TaxID=1974569 RepID=A0A2H0V0U0_9BACT|nr:MAG: hypothetical protein COU01_00360 [Candidatus Falkowbacteria bacterium CG10_big_fil_rev_8_21_14_0_10_44_15]
MKTMNDPTIITKRGDRSGTTLSVMCGVHGNEICGLWAVRKALAEIIVEAGTVHFIFANLAAIALDVRQTQMNMNRAFKPADELTESERNSYERHRAEAIMPFLAESEVLLDIHSSKSAESIPFIICEPNSFTVAQQLAFPIVSHGWDALHAGSTDYFVNQRGGQGICIECGHHYDSAAPERAYNTLVRFLGIMGAITITTSNVAATRTRLVRAHTIHRAAESFTCVKTFADFDPLCEGDLIGYDGDSEVHAPADCIIIFARNTDKADGEAFVLGSEETVG